MPTSPVTPPNYSMARAVFDAAADYFYRIQLPRAMAEISAVEATVLGVSTLVAEAIAAATAAISLVDVQKWVSGGSYTAGDARWSPSNGQTYRAKDTHSGSSLDPADDDTNTHWWLVSPTSFGYAVISRAMFRDVGYVFVDKGDSGTATQTIDVAAGTHQRIKATGNFPLAFTNWPPAGNTGEVWLDLVHDGTPRIITFPAGSIFIKYDGSETTVFSETLITLQSAEDTCDRIYFWTSDAGAKTYIKVLR